MNNTRICSGFKTFAFRERRRREQIRLLITERGGKLLRLYDRIVIRRRK